MPIQFENRLESGVKAGSAVIYPIKTNVIVSFPRSSAGLVWSRPAAVLVRTGDGEEQVLPIRDVTRSAQLGLLGLGLLGALMIWLARK